MHMALLSLNCFSKPKALDVTAVLKCHSDFSITSKTQTNTWPHEAWTLLAAQGTAWRKISLPGSMHGNGLACAAAQLLLAACAHGLA